MTTDIKIRYINATSKVDFAVVVFTKKTSVFQHLKCSMQLDKFSKDNVLLISFIQSPHQLELHNYEENGQIITSGPFPAELGTTWEITQELGETADLKQSKSKLLIPDLLKLYYFPLPTPHRG